MSCYSTIMCYALQRRFRTSTPIGQHVDEVSRSLLLKSRVVLYIYQNRLDIKKYGLGFPIYELLVEQIPNTNEKFCESQNISS